MGLDPYHAADSGSADSGSVDSGSADSGGLHPLTDISIPITPQTPIETKFNKIEDTVEILVVTAEEPELETEAEVSHGEGSRRKRRRKKQEAVDTAPNEVVEEKVENAAVTAESPSAAVEAVISEPVETKVEKVEVAEVTVTEPQPNAVLEATFSKPIASQALLPVKRTRNISMLRQPDRYVLKPAIAPLNKPAFYIPNFMPLLAVLIIFAAAALLLLRGVAVPPTNDRLAATTTPNVYSAPTVTPIVGTPVAVSNLQTAKPTAIVVTTTIAPDPTVVARIVLGSAAPVVTTETTTNPPTTAPPIVYPPVKLELTVNSDGSWVQVWVDDKAMLNELVKGKTLSFEGKDKIEVALGKPGAVKLLVNGQEKQYAPPNSGTIVKAFKSDGSEGIVNR
jgi:hypothetical protein